MMPSMRVRRMSSNSSVVVIQNCSLRIASSTMSATSAGGRPELDALRHAVLDRLLERSRAAARRRSERGGRLRSASAMFVLTKPGQSTETPTFDWTIFRCR